MHRRAVSPVLRVVRCLLSFLRIVIDVRVVGFCTRQKIGSKNTWIDMSILFGENATILVEVCTLPFSCPRGTFNFV